MSRSSPERFQYTSKVAECLRGTPGAVPYVSSLVEREHPWHAVWHLVDHWQLLEDVLRRTMWVFHGDYSDYANKRGEC